MTEGGAQALWYFAYGSNLDPSIFLEQRQMHPLDTRPARLDGYVLRFDIPIGPGERGVANIEPLAGAHIWGVAYLLAAEECDRLDYTEGVAMGIYRRAPVEVEAIGGDRLAAFTYQSTMPLDPTRKPSPRYINLLLGGGRHHALPEEYVKYLESFELAHDERVTPPVVPD